MSINHNSLLSILTATFLLTGCATSMTVVGITDGDTLTVLHDKKPIKVRHSAIDAPEHNQPYGMQAKQALSDLDLPSN